MLFPRRLAGGGVLVAIVVAGFAVNAAVRMPCREVCGSDIGRLYLDRGIDRAHPPYVDRDFEYPPLTGLVMWAASVPFDHGLRGAFTATALLMLALAAVVTWMLWRRYGTATRRWALAPPLLLEGLTNWDVLAVAPATIALLEWDAGRAASVGLLLGAGAAAKLYPALFVPILVAACIPTRAWRRARAVVLGFVAGAGAFAIPVYVAAPHALRYLVTFHRVRGPTRGSLWFFAFRDLAMNPWLRDGVRVANAGAVVITGLVLAVVVVRVSDARLDPVAACALATIAFLLANKVYSPQYDLWIVPFFVMLPISTRLVVHFYVASFVVFLCIAAAGHVVAHPLSLQLTGAAVLYRMVVLLLAARAFWRVPADRHPLGPKRSMRMSVASTPVFMSIADATSAKPGEPHT
jgi:uncharacterized membrane protein